MSAGVATPGPTWAEAGKHRRRLRVAGTIAVLAAILGIAASCVSRSGDFKGFLEVGEIILAGGHPYADATPGISTWPPVFGLVCVVLALLARMSLIGARIFWLGLNVVVLLGVLKLLVNLVYRRRLVIRPWLEGIPLTSPAILVPLLICQAGIAGNFQHLQINVFVFALTLGGLALAARGREGLGGTAIGVAAAVRVMPFAFIPYLLWRRQWKTAIWATGVAVLVFVSPVLVYGPARFVDYVQSWRDVVSGGWGAGCMNQSLWAMVDRFVGHEVVPFATEAVNTMPHSEHAAVVPIVLVVLALTAAFALYLFRGPMKKDGWIALAEWSVVFVVSAAFGPVCWKAYLVVLLLPMTLLFAIGRARTGQADGIPRVAAGLLVVSFLTFSLPTRDLLGRTLARHLEMSSIFPIGAILLIAGLYWLRPRLREPEQRPPG